MLCPSTLGRLNVIILSDDLVNHKEASFRGKAVNTHLLMSF